MPIYTIEELREVARDKDERLEDTLKYPDEWIDTRIDRAFETAESGKQIFTNEEAIDMKPFAEDGVEKFVLTMDEEVHKHYQAIVTDPRAILVNIENDNRVSVTIDIESILAAKESILTLRYFFYPHIPFENIFIPSEVYHYWRHCLYVNLYGSLKDKENEIFHQEQVDTFITTGSMQLPNDFDEFINAKNNFDLVSGTQEKWL